MGTRYLNFCPDPVNVKPQSNGEIVITWEDGNHSITDMRPVLKKQIFARMRNYEVWCSAFITNDGAISWGEGLDFAPEFFYKDIISRHEKI